MPTLPDYPEISQIKHESPGFLHRSRQFPFFQIKLTFEPSVEFSRNFSKIQIFFLWFWSSYYSFEWHFSMRIVYLFHHWYRLLFSTSFKTMYNVLTHTNILILSHVYQGWGGLILEVRGQGVLQSSQSPQYRQSLEFRSLTAGISDTNV